MKLLIMQSSPASRHFLLLRSKCSTQYPVLRHTQTVILLSARDQVSHPYKTTGKNIIIIIIIFTFYRIQIQHPL